MESASPSPGRRGGAAARGFRPDIEGLRAVAVLLVVLYHVGVPGFGGGYVGVDVFFVLSGYLITGLLFDEFTRSGRIAFKQFYARRARRLLPGCALMLLATIVCGRVVLSPVEQLQFAGTAIATAAYVSNLWFARNQMDYLGGEADLNPLMHTWSLGVEEQFYLVWPAFITVAARARRGDRRVVVAAMGLIAAVSFVLAAWLTRTSEPVAFYSLPTRAWEFAVGAVAALQFPARERPAGRFAPLVTVIGLLALAVATVTFTARTPFPGSAALLPVLGTAMVLAGGALAPAQPILRPLHSAPMQAIGRLSYSWYLWHWPVLVLAGAYVGRLSLGGRLAAEIASLGIAAAAYVLVENRVRYASFLIARPRLSLAGAAAVTLLGLTTGYGWRLAARSAASEPAQARYALAREDLPQVYASGCHLTFLEVREPPCAFADVASPTTVVLFGDSHAAEWFPALDTIATREQWRLVSFTKSGCPAADVRIYASRLERSYSECDEWRALSLRRIEGLHPALVVLASASHYVVHGAAGSPDAIGDREWTDGLRRTLAPLVADRVPVALIADTPAPGFDVLVCLSRLHWVHGPGGRGCTFPLRAAVDSQVARDVVRVASHLRGVRVVDLSDVICAGGVCAPEQDGMVVYRDADHLTAHYVASLAPALAGRLGVPLPPSPQPPRRGTD